MDTKYRFFPDWSITHNIKTALYNFFFKLGSISNLISETYYELLGDGCMVCPVEFFKHGQFWRQNKDFVITNQVPIPRKRHQQISWKKLGNILKQISDTCHKLFVEWTLCLPRRILLTWSILDTIWRFFLDQSITYYIKTAPMNSMEKIELYFETDIWNILRAVGGLILGLPSRFFSTSGHNIEISSSPVYYPSHKNGTNKFCAKKPNFREQWNQKKCLGYLEVGKWTQRIWKRRTTLIV